MLRGEEVTRLSMFRAILSRTSEEKHPAVALTIWHNTSYDFLVGHIHYNVHSQFSGHSFQTYWKICHVKWRMTPPPVPILTDTTVPIDTTQPSHGSINAHHLWYRQIKRLNWCPSWKGRDTVIWDGLTPLHFIGHQRSSFQGIVSWCFLTNVGLSWCLQELWLIISSKTPCT